MKAIYLSTCVVSVTSAPVAGSAVVTAVRSTPGGLEVLSGSERLRGRAGALKLLGFDGTVGELVAVPDGDDRTAFAFGVGAAPSSDAFRRGGMRVAAATRAREVALDLVGITAADRAGCAAAFVEGFELGSHVARPRESVAATRAIGLHVDGEPAEALIDACHMAKARAAAVNIARTLVDAPPSAMTPEAFAGIAQDMADDLNWRWASLDADALARERFGGVLSVAAGSERPPFLVDVTFAGRRDGPIDIVLIGKGVTMDCGGLNIKTRGGRTATMKCDMAGGAAVLAALAGVQELGVQLNVRVLVPLAENLPGRGATLPGDVITHRGGRTTEVVNTDAEGRLLLADALAYAAETSDGADMITVGTLSSAFGPGIAPVVGEDQELAAEVLAAAAAVDEVAAHLPPTRDYDAVLTSDVADAKNYSWDRGSFDLISAASFMRPFAGGRRWVHIDIADVTYLMAPWGAWGVGATGAPTRTLVELLARRGSAA